jgi:hypothetical protein
MYNIHNYWATIKVQETLFPGEDYKGEKPLFLLFFLLRKIDDMGLCPHTPPGDSIPWTSFIAVLLAKHRYMGLCPIPHKQSRTP